MFGTGITFRFILSKKHYRLELVSKDKNGLCIFSTFIEHASCWECDREENTGIVSFCPQTAYTPAV